MGDSNSVFELNNALEFVGLWGTDYYNCILWYICN